MKHEIALPENKKIIPKPTKNEIIAAMVEIAREKFKEEKKLLHAKLEELHGARQSTATDRALRELQSVEVDLAFYDFDEGRLHINHSFVLTDADRQAHLEIRTVRDRLREAFDEKSTRQKIREAVYGTGNPIDRVNLLLNDKESRAHLETVLLEISKPAVVPQLA